MRIEAVIARTLSVVDRALRSEFPDDYDRRCLYAAFAVSSLLNDAGVEANIVGGDFLAFVLSTSGDTAGLQGFGLGDDQPSHFWVEIEGTIVDLGPYYLPRGSSFPAVPMPLIAWKPAADLPMYLRYRPQISYPPEAELQSDPKIIARKNAFVALCHRRYKSQVGQPKLPTWILSNLSSLETAVRAGDVWARNAIIFAKGMNESRLPF